jgi:hypothetical protein
MTEELIGKCLRPGTEKGGHLVASGDQKLLSGDRIPIQDLEFWQYHLFSLAQNKSDTSFRGVKSRSKASHNN